MTVARARGPKAKADKLFSLYIRSRGVCEACGDRDYTKLQTAHIVSRRFNATRVDPANAYAMCWKCHHHFTAWPLEFAAFVVKTKGQAEYDRLKAKAEAGVKVNDAFWLAEVERLSALMAQTGGDAA